MISADVERKIIETLQTMQKLIYTTGTAKVFNDVKDKDIVLFVGNTRCGKSTIVNFVIGNQLTANRIRGTTYNITKTNPSSPGPEIGTGSTSETTIPSAWPSSKISGLVVDAPGFDDNRGVAQDVANSFYVKEIINNAKSVKFALITDIKDITGDNIGNFIAFIDKILTMLPHTGHLHKGMVMLLTKDKEEYTNEDIRDIFKSKILDQPVLQVANRQLVHYLIANLNRFVIIRMPTKSGPIQGSEVFNNLIETIENNAVKVTKMEMSGVTPGIADRSKAFLLESHRFFTESNEFDEVLKLAFAEFMKILGEYNIAANSGTTASTLALKQKLSALEDQVAALRDSQGPLFDKMKQLGALVPHVNQLKENSEIFLKLKFVYFVDEVLKIKEGVIFTVKIDAIVSHMVNRTAQAKLKLQEKMLEITEAETTARINSMMDSHRQTTENLTKMINDMKEENKRVMENQRKSMKMCTIL